MKKIYTTILIIIMSLGLVACSNGVKKEEGNTSDEKVKVYATIFPIYDFVSSIFLPLYLIIRFSFLLIII